MMAKKNLLVLTIIILGSILMIERIGSAESLQNLERHDFVAVFKEVAAGEYIVVHLMKQGHITLARHSGENLRVAKGQVGESVWRSAWGTVAAAGLSTLESQFHPSSKDPALIYEDVFYTLISRSSKIFFSVTLHESALPNNFRYAVDLLLRLPEEHHLAPIDGWLLKASEMRLDSERIGGDTITKRGYELSRTRDELPRLVYHDGLFEDIPELRLVVWYLERYISLPKASKMHLLNLTKGNLQFYLEKEDTLYLLKMTRSSN